MNNPQTTNAELTDEQIQTAEDHRDFVREMHDRLGRAYGFGGAVVAAVLFAVVAVAAVMGWWAKLTLWIPGLTAGLVALYIVRRRIYAHRDELRDRVEHYCEINDVCAETLVSYYDSQQMYEFFSAIFETRPGRIQE